MSVSLLESGGDTAPGRISQTAWVAQRDLDIDEWIAAGRLLGGMSRCSQWGIGDWIRYGNAKFGERYKRASEITGYDPQTLMNMVYVASRFEISRRRESLSWSHHEVVAGLEVSEQDRWLDRAVTEGWQRSHLRSLVRGVREEDAERSQPARASAGVLPADDPEEVFASIAELELENELEVEKPLKTVSAVRVIDDDVGDTSMRSAVNWALLGLLIERPSYGYELTQRFEYTYGELIELSSASHVYAALEVLVSRGMIQAMQTSGGDGASPRQPKLHYAATAAGVSGYERYLVQQVADERRRGQLFALQVASVARRPGSCEQVLDGCEKACEGDVVRPGPVAVGRMDGGVRVTEELLAESDRLLIEAKRAWLRFAQERVAGLTVVG